MNVDLSELARLFDLARTAAPESRQTLIDTECGNNQWLKDQIHELLQEDLTHDELFDNESAIANFLNCGFPKPGCQIGPYALEKEIGSGGMATVFLANQLSPIQRRVALKVVREGFIPREAIARFEAEKQVLAAIDHPFVTKIFDAGVTNDGLFYFSMDFVEGKAITEFCDEHQVGLSERVRLFCDVCDGIEHAHQKGIVHRDIKPSNILVSNSSGKLQPKIIDFGIAKALDHFKDQVEFLEATRDGIMIGTPKYMSPEQADMRHDSVDSRTDVYSLGVVLHELIVGETPLGSSIRDQGLIKSFELARESSFTSPSAKVLAIEDKTVFEKRNTSQEKMVSFLKSDLEAIMLKAMNGDPEQRYQTVREFREDIERFCNGTPVHAARFDFVNVSKKWVKRNRVFALAAALILAAVTLATCFSLYHISKASSTSQENDALRTRLDAKQKGLSEANCFRQKVELFALAKKAYEKAMDRYLKKNRWASMVAESEVDTTMASFRSILEANIKAHGLGPIIPSEFSLEEGVIPVLDSIPDLGSHGPIAADPIVEDPMMEDFETVVSCQNNQLCELIYEEQKQMLGCSNEVIANTCEMWAQYLICCKDFDKAQKLVGEAAIIRNSLGPGKNHGQICFNLILRTKCWIEQGKRSEANELMRQASAMIEELENLPQKKMLRAFCAGLEEKQGSLGLN